MTAPQTSESLPARLLHRLADYVYRYPRWFFYPHALLFAVSVFYTVTELQFSTDRNDLVGSDKKYHQNFLRFKEEFAVLDDVVAVVESEDMEKNRQFVERLGARLESETNLFASVFYKGDLKMLGPKALLFLPEPTLDELHRILEEYQPFVQKFAQTTNLNSFFRKINETFRTLGQQQLSGTNSSAAESDAETFAEAVPALRRIVELATDSLVRPGTPVSPGINALFDAGKEAESEQYLTFSDGRIYIVSALPLKEELESDAVARMRELVRQTEAEVPGVNAGVTGESVLEIDEMRQSQEDTTVATVVALSLVALVFIVAYRETGRPLKATVSLVVGLAYTMGYTTLVVGHLNILTITFLPILIGLAIDFGIHLITRYEEELRHKKSKREALEKAMVKTGLGIFTGGFTTAGAFFAMGLTDFKGIQEMGIITGGGMLICLVPMMTLLPVLLLQGRQNIIDHKRPPGDRRARMERAWLERPMAVIVVTGILAMLAATQIPKVNFDYNLLNMQSKDLAAVTYIRKLIEGASKSVLYAASVADSLEQAMALEARFTNLTTVAGVDSMAPFLTADQSDKLRKIRQIKEVVEPIRFAEPDTEFAQPAALSQTLQYTLGYLGRAAEAATKEGATEIAGQIRALRQSIIEFRHRLADAGGREPVQRLSAFERALFGELRETFDAMKAQDASAPLTAGDLPPELKNRFIGRTGKHLLQIYPKENVWQREPQERFVRELRSVDPNVTGTPVQLLEYTTLLKESYQHAAWYALGAIVVLVWIHFKNLWSVVLSLLPVGLGLLWMVGLMGALGIPFNPANIMTLPLVIGIGVTNGIHILNRFAEEKNPGILGKSTGKAVLVSGLTTIAGFGSLIPAEHQGIASLGMVMSIGVATCMIAALTFLPALLNYRMAIGSRKTGNPVPTMHGRHWVGRNRG